MSSNSYYLFFHLCFLLIISTCLAQTTFHPKTLFLAVKKDPSTLLYITEIQQRTPLVPVKLALHLGGESLWVVCRKGYTSSTYKPAICNSTQCHLGRQIGCGGCHRAKPRLGCNKNACNSVISNPPMGNYFTGSGEVAVDVLSIQSLNGSVFDKGPVVTVPNFIFSCAVSALTQSLGTGVKGMVGFGQQSPISLATQFASAFKFSRKFAICLSPSTDQNGIIFIGNSPYLFALGFDPSQSLIYTPIISNPNFLWGLTSPEYYIQVSSIMVSGKALPINKTLLSLDENVDRGGTRISTTVPYTLLEASIYDAVSKAFVNEMPKDVKIVAPVQPFKTCFNSTYIGMSRLGYNAPQIDIVLHKPNVYWTITGANSLIKVSEGVLCLAFVEQPETSWRGQSIIVGGYQMQDNLVEFDLSRGRIGFSNSLYFRQTMCANQFYTN